MKASELRIGNWVKVGVVNMVVCDVLCDSINTEMHECLPYDHVEPIPITEEWLLKLGFRQLDKYTFCYGKGFFVYHRKTGFKSNKRRHPFGGIHDLQNLYFACYSEELKIEQ